MQLTENKGRKEGKMKLPKSLYPVFTLQKVVIKPHHQETLYPKVKSQKNLEGPTGLIIPQEELENIRIAIVIISGNSRERQLSSNTSY